MGLDFKSDPACDHADSLARENQALRAEIDALRADVERHESYGGELEGRLAEQAECLGAAQAEIDALNVKILAAVSVLLDFAGRLGVGDDELADLLADAQMRAEARP